MHQIQHYQLGGIVGRGATSRVVRAVDLRNGETVAIKLLRRPVSSQAVELLFQEYQLRKSLDIEGVLPACHYAELSDRAFLVMPLIANGSLADLLKHTHDLKRLMDCFLNVCHIVARLHEAGVIHRDLKPGNILVEESGKVWITDFAFALRTSQPELHIPNQIVGTPGFMSPEQASGDRNRLGPATDIFSLGRLLQKILDAHDPPNPATTAVVHADVEHQLTEQQRSALREIVEACTRSEISARPATATAVAKQVEQVITSPAEVSPPSDSCSASARSPRGSIRQSPRTAPVFVHGRVTAILCATAFVLTAASGADVRSPATAAVDARYQRQSADPDVSNPYGTESSMQVFLSGANETDKQADLERHWRQSTRYHRLIDFNGFLYRPRPLAAGLNRIHPRMSLIVDGTDLGRQLITPHPAERLRINDTPLLQLEIRRHGPTRVRPRFEIHPDRSDPDPVNAIALEISSPMLEHLVICINGTDTAIRFPSGSSRAFLGMICPETIRSLSFETSVGSFAEFAVDNVQIATSLAEH